MEQANQDQSAVRGVGRPKKPKKDPAETPRQDNQAQYLARRIWDGQSPSLPRNERIARVRRGVEAQGLSMEGVSLE